jgi:hypothetical protein
MFGCFSENLFFKQKLIFVIVVLESISDGPFKNIGNAQVQEVAVGFN